MDANLLLKIGIVIFIFAMPIYLIYIVIKSNKDD